MRFFAYIFILIFPSCFAQQREVSITIDDVPNVRLYQQDRFKSLLLERIETLQIPVAIFINEKNIDLNEFGKKNTEGLERWLKNKNVTAGNHSYSHINYADTTLNGFQEDILKGEILTTKIIRKRPAYFRFPFNSLGDDSLAHANIRKFLAEKGYRLTPFTVESEDWAYNSLYENALKTNDTAKAKQIGQQYISHTILLFEYFESLSNELYGRNIKHIYLCHDNRLNTDYMVELVNQLRNKGYSFITLERALQDKVYQSNEYYTGRYGFSWIYRWEKNLDKRKIMMRREPTDEAFRNAYEKFVSEK